MKKIHLTALLFSVTLLFLSGTSWAKMRNLDIRIGLELQYDDNVFQYSDKDLNNFKNGPAKFGTLNSPKDLLWIPSLKASYRIRHKLDTRMTFQIEPKFHQQNTIRNYQVYTARIEQELPWRSELGLRYLLVPRFFLRPLADPPNQSIIYNNADFTLQTIKLSFDKTFKKGFNAEVLGVYEKKDYNPDFDERDTTVISGGVKLRLSPNRTFKVTLGTDYEQGTAKGENDASINSDISYTQWSAYIKPSTQLSNQISLDFGYTYASKHFTTDLTADISHANRDDITQTTEVQFKTRFAKRLDARLDYERLDKKSNKTGVDVEFASFSENRVIAGFLFEF